MKRSGTATLAFVLMALLSTSLAADHHVTGKWVLAVSLSDGQGGDATFELEEEEGGKLSGSYSGALGQEEVGGTVNGNEVQFSFDSEAGKVTFEGVVKDGTMSGQCTYGQLGSGTFEGKKQE